MYGLVEAISIFLYLGIFWKFGWSKAPRDERLCTVITKSYELEGNQDFLCRDESDGVDDGDKDAGVEVDALGQPLLDPESTTTASEGPSEA